MQIIITEQQSNDVALHFTSDAIIHNGYFPSLPFIVNKIVSKSTIFEKKLNYKIESENLDINVYIEEDEGVLHFYENAIIDESNFPLPIKIVDFIVYSDKFYML